ncbi:hypothetical protein [Ornithinimicrobium kibberense]|uniref:hypothetical protein n=1 Tax=Ornithinimicrobium kibberense TaxID=282060 RepID=UPI0036230436
MSTVKWPESSIHLLRVGMPPETASMVMRCKILLWLISNTCEVRMCRSLSSWSG